LRLNFAANRQPAIGINTEPGAIPTALKLSNISRRIPMKYAEFVILMRHNAVS
jgi:hypothetical protein